MRGGAWGAARGAVSLPRIASVGLLGVLLVAVLWAARVAIIAYVLQTAAQGLATTVAASGCWTPAASQALQRDLRPIAWTEPLAEIQVEAPAVYAPYGQTVQVVLRAPVGLWHGAVAGGATWTLQAQAEAVSLAPTTQFDSCTAPPSQGG